MLLRLIEDINKALDNDASFSALALALTLPDICGKTKYPEEKSTKKRYIDWYDEYVGKYEKDPDEKQMPYLSGEVIYSLRCCFLHEGNPNIEKEKIKEEACKIDRFSLLTDKKKPFEMYADSACVNTPLFSEAEKELRYTVNVRRLCLILIACAKGYYTENQAQFGFFDYDIMAIDET